MVRKSIFRPAKPFDPDKYLRKIGFGKQDRPFWKAVARGYLITYAIWGAAWWFNETSPLGWWTFKPRPKEEKEMAYLYERRMYPYPGDEKAMAEFVARGGMIGTTIGPKGFVETDPNGVNFEKQMQDEKMEQEAMKLWVRMRNEVVTELEEKGFRVE